MAGRPRLVALVLIIVAGLVAGAVSTAAPQRVESQQPDDQSQEQGLVFAGGRWAAPPYELTVVGGDLLLNGEVVRAGPSRSGDAIEPAPATPRTAGELVQVAAARFRELGGRPSAEVTADLIGLLRSLPATAEVIDNDDELLVRDQDGDLAALLLDFTPATPPDGAAAAQAARVEQWQDLLAAGGILLLIPGVTLTIPPQDAAAFVSDVQSVLALPEAERTDRMRELVGDDDVAAALLAAGPLPDAIRGRLMSRATGAAGSRSPALTEPARAGAPDGLEAKAFADPDSHKLSRTPKTLNAYIFLDRSGAGADANESIPVERAALLHSYHVIQRENEGGCTPGGFTLKNFLDSAGKTAILYVHNHSGPDALSIERYCRERDAKAGTKAAADKLGLGRGNTGPGHENDPFEVYYGLVPDRTDDWYNVLTEKGIKNRWTSINDRFAIVQISGCHSAGIKGVAAKPGLPNIGLQAAFDAREFIGTNQLLYTCAKNIPNASLWDRIAGIVDTGTKRNVGDAYDASDFPGTGLWEHFGNGEGKTVLSPAVWRITPAARGRDGSIPVYEVGTPVTTEVLFDAFMDTKVVTVLNENDENLELRNKVIVWLKGTCKAEPQGLGVWLDDRRFQFTWVPNASGTATFDIQAAGVSKIGNVSITKTGAASADNTASLDGNQGGRAVSTGGADLRPLGRKYPIGTDHVDGNNDDYVWNVLCSAPATTGGSTPPPASTPQNTSLPTATPRAGQSGETGLKFTPFQARPGEMVSYVAAGFTPGQQGELRFQDMVVSRAVVNAAGEAQGTFFVPPVAAGPAVITFTTRVDEPFVTTFSVIGGPGTLPGTTPTATPMGPGVLPPGGQPSPTATGGVPAGPATLAVVPSQGRPGSSVSVAGNGFTPNGTVRVCWVSAAGTCAVTLYNGPVNGAGGFSFTAVVPADTPGPHVIDATDSAGRHASAPFTVTTGP